MPFIEVRKKNCTSGKTPPAGYNNWLEFWEGKMGKKATTCEVMSCDGKPDIGGYVIKDGEDGKGYILPLCYSCNNKPEGEIFKAWKIDLVSVK